MNGSWAIPSNLDSAYFQRQMQLPAIGYGEHARFRRAGVSDRDARG